MRKPLTGGESLVGICMIEVKGPDSDQNLALNSTATAYSSYGTYTPDRAISGSANDFWVCANGIDVFAESTPIWFQLDLGKIITFDSISVSGRKPPSGSSHYRHYPGKFDILASADGVDWFLLKRLTEEVTSEGSDLTKVYP